MIFDCHFRHAIVINRLSIQINRHLSTPIDCQRRPAIRLFPQSIAQRHPAIRLFPQSIAQRHPAIRPFDYPLNRLPTSSGHSIISSIDCPGFTPWAGVCRVFDAGENEFYSSSLYFSTTSFFFFLQSTYNPLDFK